MSRSSTAPPCASSSSGQTPSRSGDEPPRELEGHTGPEDRNGLEVLDLRGEVCPYTFVRTRLRLEDLPLGARLHILVDHEPATRNIPRSARDWGQAVDAVEPAGQGLWRIVLRKQVE